VLFIAPSTRGEWDDIRAALYSWGKSGYNLFLNSHMRLEFLIGLITKA